MADNTVSRVSSFSVHSNLLRDVMRVQSEMFNYQDQLSSGLKSRNYAGISGSVELFVDLGSRVRKSDRYIENITVATTRLNTMNKSLDDVISIAENMKGLMTQWRSSDKDNLNAKQQFLQAQQGLAAALNANMEGRYLFGGTKTDTPPIDTSFPTPANAEVASASYYQGSDQNITFRAQDTYEFSYNIRGDDPALQKVISALNLALNATTTGSDDTMKSAIEMMSAGIAETIGLQTTTNVNIIGLKDIQDRHTATQTYFKGLTDDVIKTDIVEVSTKLAYHEATLQAAYQAFSKINGLRLSDYLK